ncbi:hypothetical protein Meth11DRAFT_1481 [Methylophilaceae bacterium 11]|jgi:uncharacterized protein (DUF58 family)|uniref:DUF58 domain-containing protein n=1 Tax=unclassified Methylotenera TaxID=2643294 RepID=UPI00036A7BCD|nr:MULTISPECIES: VWA domain-containing protein [unclassified Methylotenera]EUJ10655.1 hypothetical protein Meth11DRAFT_1481 [Methylophilaceae bacterium 11]
MEEFFYHIGWRTRGGRVGSHSTKAKGGNTDFNAHVPLMQHFNPKRLDLKASLNTVPNQLMVRSFHERYAIQVFAVVDMSASMKFVGQQNKWQLSTDIVQAIAWSATRNGDAFGCVAADDTLRMDIYEPSAYRVSVVDDIVHKMRSTQPLHPAGAKALPRVTELLPERRSLIFLISDFHMDDALLTESLHGLAMHDVVPVVLWDTAEISQLPDWGWMRVNDMEGRGTRPVFLRPRLKKAIENAYLNRREHLAQLFRAFGTRPPFFVLNQFNSEAMTQHLLEDY